jgi:tetratricopeptide (TPR) repeat protein
MPMRRGISGLTMVVATVALQGCVIAATLRSYDTTPDGLERRDAQIRRALVSAEGNRHAVDRAGRMPEDQLLRALYEGTLAYYAGAYDVAVNRFELAYWLTEERYTKSLSRGALSLVTSDRALEYLPGQNERLFINYYSALSYLKKGEPAEAAVEARRLVFQLQRLDEGSTERDRRTRAMLRYFAGAVFEAAGERNDAIVAYRNAALALGDTAGARREKLPDDGSVIAIIERGFVAHRVNTSIWVELGHDEARLFTTRDDERYRRGAVDVAGRVHTSLGERDDHGLFVGEEGTRRFPAPDSLRAQAADSVSALIAADTSAVPVVMVPTTVVSLPQAGDATKVAQPKPAPKPRGPDTWIRENILKGNSAAAAVSETSGVELSSSGSHRRNKASIDDDDYVLRVSLPAFHRPRPDWTPRVMSSGAPLQPLVSASVSEAVIADYARQRNAVLARAVARAATRLVVTKAAEKTAEDKWGETTGDVVGFFTNMAGVALERADTRSWVLLPESISIVRTGKSAADSLSVVEAARGRQKSFRAGNLSVTTQRLWAAGN